MGHAVLRKKAGPGKALSNVWVNGKSLSERDSVIDAIASGLEAAHHPVIVVDAVDLAGAAEVVGLAQALGCVLDHSKPGNLPLMQEQEWLATTPGEAVVRSDAVLLVGPLPDEIATDEALRRLCENDRSRTFRYVGSDAPPSAIQKLVSSGLAGSDLENLSLTALLGGIRAHIKGRALSGDPMAQGAIAALGDWMMAARYGVAAFATGALSEIEGHALTGLLDDLSEKTRWNALPLAIPPGQSELLRMASSLTGLPAPLGFGRNRPVHDRWRFGIQRPENYSEHDAALWLSASETAPPDWMRGISNLFAITAHEEPLADLAAQAQIGTAGVDYAAILEPPEIGAFAAITPPEPSGRNSAACIVGAVRQRIETKGTTV